MPSDNSPRWLKSEEEIFNWLNAAPRTYGWQVLMALDRARANQLLLQEYIGRYSSALYLKPITDVVKIVDGATQVWEYLYEHRLGPPRLSFENSIVNAWARLTLPVLGGLQLTVEQSGVAPKHVSRICWYDPLQSPRLICEIRLEDAPGEVDYGKQVQLDLRNGTDFRLTFASTHQGQLAGGRFYAQLFEALPDDEQRMVLGQLDDFPKSAVLRPDKFRLRALSASPAVAGEVDGLAEGALLVFVGTEGNDPGQLPDKDATWVYPIPAGHSSTVLLSSAVVFKGLMANGVKMSATWNDRCDYVDDGPGGSTTGMHFTRGWLERRTTGIDLDCPELATCNIRVPFRPSEQTDLRIDKDGEDFVMSWRARTPGTDGAYVSVSFPTVADNWASFNTQWTMQARYRFAVNPETGGVQLALAAAEGLQMETTRLSYSAYEPYRSAMQNAAPVLMQETLTWFQQHVAAGTDEIELFRVYGLLFSGNNVVQHRRVRMACDLAVFGELSPASTSYGLEPAQKDLLHGRSVQFMTTPPRDDLTWGLLEVPGFPEPLGYLDQRGLYTAPSAAEISTHRTYTMVRITATSPDGKHTSEALVRVMRRSVALNPMVVVAAQGTAYVRFSAGSLEQGALRWSVRSLTGARLTDVPPEEDEAEFDEGDRFYLPGSGSTGDVFSVDELSVLDANGNVAWAHLVLLEKPIMATVRVMDDVSTPEGQVQLGLDAGGTDPITADAVWKVLAGGGKVDYTGRYTLDPQSPFPYAVVSATFAPLPSISVSGYIILPIPLVDLEEMQRVLA